MLVKLPTYILHCDFCDNYIIMDLKRPPNKEVEIVLEANEWTMNELGVIECNYCYGKESEGEELYVGSE